MISEFLYSRLLHYFDYEPTQAQEQLLRQFSDYILNPSPDHVFVIKGFAGTGKTTLVNTITRTLSEIRYNTVLLAPTGRAAKVLSGYSGQSALTIHKKIYRQKSAGDLMADFSLDRNLHSSTFFLVDEASMIGDSSPENSYFGSGDLLKDLVDYVKKGKNCYLVLIGDTAQLPPVGINLSPALDSGRLGSLGLKVSEFFLEDIVRQARDSGILENATRIRQLISDQNPEIPQLRTSGLSDIQTVSGNEIIEEIESCYNRYGTGETIIITRSNKRANQFNTGIRNRILWREEEINSGDYLMVVRNNYFWKISEDKLDFIANGDIARLEKIYRFENIYDFRFADVCLFFPDYDLFIDAKILLDTLSLETPALDAEKSNALFNKIAMDYPGLSRKDLVKKIRENPYFNALQIKFAYAVTCHKAQGGQWKAVFVDPGYFKEEMINIEYLRWLYTAFTRATEKLYLVNFPEMFFGD